MVQLIEDSSDLGKVLGALESASTTLDYRRYGDTLFEMLITGGSIAPGGIIETDPELGTFPASLFSLLPDDSSVEQMAGKEGAGPWADMVLKLARRFKYLEVTFSESAEHLLENIHRYSERDSRKLAVGYALLATKGLMGLEVARTLRKEHLVKDCRALIFMTDVMRVFLMESSLDQLRKSLKRARIQELIEFFPANKRDEDCFVRHFEAEDMPEVIQMHREATEQSLRDSLVQETIQVLKQAKLDDEDSEAVNVRVAKMAHQAMKSNGWEENQTVVLAWNGVMGALDLALRPDQIEIQVVGQIKRYADVLKFLTNEPKSEISLIKHAQLYMYRNSNLTKFFGRVVFELYNEDVLSGSAIIFWAKRAVRAEGKAGFLKQTEAFVSKLEALEEEDEDSEDSD